MANALVYPEHGLLYNRVKKSGNSSIVFYLRDLVQHAGSSSQAAGGSISGGYADDKRSAVGVGKKLPDLSMRELMGVRRLYAFTIFRNPYTRCLSAFFSKSAKRESGSEKYRDVPGFDNKTPEGFEAFVGFLEDGGLYYDKHFWPQCDLLMCPPQYFARIGQLENLQQELTAIFGKAGMEVQSSLVSNQPHAADQNHAGKVTGANARTAQFYSEPLYDRVFQLYRRDFEVGNYDRNWRPVSAESGSGNA
ncbi:MAG: sulfotransferase family 2 domain-containing protein [Ectothiorhodospiraceae bacterium]|nr:sulfotransferase family 2 domain-containing protein [Ectothiorhodospiraceae bacterium]